MMILKALLDNLERYINVPKFHEIDSLIKMPIIHFQFESIHPYFDGNGRTGRLLNILYLVQQGLLDVPVLYLSSYIIKNKSDYYRLLQDVRTKGSWEEWIVWMLKGVELTAKETIVVVNKTKVLVDEYKKEFFPFRSHFSATNVGSALLGKDILNEVMGKAFGFNTVKPPKLIE